MVKLKYTSWKNIPVGIFKKLLAIGSDSSLDEVDSEIRILSILCDCDEEDILNLTITDYQKIRRESQWIAYKPKSKAYCPKSVKLDNQYDIVYDISKLTAAQYIDFQSYIKLNDSNKYLSNILAIFFIPKGKKYGEVDAEEIIKDIDNNLNMEMAESMCFFFTTQFLTLTKHFLLYLESELNKKLKKSKGKDRIEIMERMGIIRSQINGIGSIK